jgi:hypothetical protein
MDLERRRPGRGLGRLAACCSAGLLATTNAAAADAGAEASPASAPTTAAPADAGAEASPASAPTTAAPAGDAPPEPEPRLPSPLPEIAAVFPGVVVHGSGVWLQRRNPTAQRLLLLEGSAILATLASGVILFQTGAARNLVGPSALLGVAGAGGFAVSFLANLYATWAPRDGFGAAATELPLLDASLGYLYVYDPQFAYRHFGALDVSARLGPWHLLASAALAANGDSQRLELGAGYRVLGPRGPELDASGARSARDGSYLEPRVGVIEHRFPDDGFSSLVVEAELEGRLDSARYLPDVHGAFFTANAGYARQIFHHDLPGPNPSTSTSLLLAGVGFGIYLGHPSFSPRSSRPPGVEPSGGELEIYYDHRHDGFAGGLKVNGLGSGVAGHFGLRGEYQLSERWGVRARGEVGSAYTLGLDLVIRAGQGLP